MPNNEDIKIYFEEGELINKYLESQEKGIEEAQPVLFIVDSDDETGDEDINQKAYVSCDSCNQQIMNYCPKCGTLDVHNKGIGHWCSSCAFHFTTGEILKEHKRRCQLKPQNHKKYVACPFCSRKKDSRLLYSHLKICGAKNSRSTQQIAAPISIKYNEKDLYSYTSNICKMEFNNVDTYVNHNHNVNLHNMESPETPSDVIACIPPKNSSINPNNTTSNICKMEFNNVHTYVTHNHYVNLHNMESLETPSDVIECIPPKKSSINPNNTTSNICKMGFNNVHTYVTHNHNVNLHNMESLETPSDVIECISSKKSSINPNNTTGSLETPRALRKRAPKKSDIMTVLKCPLCLTVYLTDESLLEHVRRHHSTQRYFRPILPKVAKPVQVE